MNNKDAHLVIGIDFDNTIVSYDDLFHNVAEERGISIPYKGSKKALRDFVRHTPSGEVEWQKIQAIVYGPRIGDAKLIEGVDHFLKLCMMNEVKVYVISHKSEYATQDTEKINLREAALKWMELNKFFNDDGLGIDPNSIYFGLTRKDKIKYIMQLGCTHFIDDLEETFLEETFPVSVRGILYSPLGENYAPDTVTTVRSWQEICNYFFSSGE
jgi:hypothetical protein